MNRFIDSFIKMLYFFLKGSDISEQYLRKLCEMSNGEYKIIDRYKVGRRIGIFKSQTDDTVNELHSKGLIKKIGSSNVLLTFEGKQEVERLRSNDPF